MIPILQLEMPPRRRTRPISSVFGYDRGPQSVARYYVDAFIYSHSDDIRGRVLEVGDTRYSSRFGDVVRRDVLHIAPGNPAATIVADLSAADNIPDDTFDCMILTQTLQCIYDVAAAVHHIHRVLRPGGCVLATLSGISQVSRPDMDRWGEFWHFTPRSASLLFEPVFSPQCVTMECHGNIGSAMALLYGLAAREVSPELLARRDKCYPIVIGVRAAKR